MTTINLEELIPRCHEAAKAKGFWDVRPDPRQQLMLTIGELGEAQEAHRKGKMALVRNVVELREEVQATPDYTPEWLAYEFEGGIKDSVGDELADTYIRLCDYAGGFEVDVMEWENSRQTLLRNYNVDTIPENFGAALLPIVQDILNINTARKLESSLSLSAALAKLEMLCRAKDIDLATHIDLKLRYNATRARLHGKTY